jgi:eukaryotic-like serine/threonine-protein kinase
MDVVGGYQLEERVGSGSSGTVWRARSTDPLARLVALKRVGGAHREDDASRLEREASILAELDHPHIMRVLGIVGDGDGVAIVMPYAAGGSLEQLLARQGRLTPSRAVAVVAPIAEALASAHRAGVLHGDVKPGNILFTSGGEALLSDFGVARWLSGPAAADDGSKGTAEYLAPEVLEGAAPDVRSDVYALGVVAYEVLTGHPPYTGPTALSVIRAADAGDHEPVDRLMPEVPPALAAVVEAAIDRRPERRPASAAELATRLRAAVPAVAAPADPEPSSVVSTPSPPAGPRATQTFGPRPPAPPPPPVPSPWPRRVAAGGLVAVAAAVVAGAVAVFGTGGAPAASPAPPATTVPAPSAAEAPASCSPDGEAAPSGTATLAGDIDGDGREEPVLWREVCADGEVVVAVTLPERPDEATFRVGRAGDVVVLGDWDCDGVDTVAIYRPADGHVFAYDDWPGLGAGTDEGPLAGRTETTGAARRTGIVDGVSRVEQGGDGCDELVVEPAG